MTVNSKLSNLSGSVAQPEATKLIKNYSLQGLYVILETSEGSNHVWLEPKKAIRVPENQISQQIKNLHKRRLVIISN
jgi:tRNA A37 threonylcarbamoyladenosine synthetase subunit TsaC/SUA5/YrdC